jgi:hypothetical protein
MAFALLAVPTVSHAGSVAYCGEDLTPPYTACDQDVQGLVNTEVMNQGYYLGSGTMYVCEKITSQFTPSTIYSRVCTYLNQCGGDCYEADSGTICLNSVDMAALAGNNSAYTHTVWGYTEWDWGGTDCSGDVVGAGGGPSAAAGGPVNDKPPAVQDLSSPGPI